MGLRWTGGRVGNSLVARHLRSNPPRPSHPIVRILILSVLALFLAGCEAMPSRLSERFAPAEPQVRELETARVNVFPALEEAFERISFTVTRSRQAEGVVAGQSRILSDDSFRGARQYQLEVRVSEFDTDLTKVTVALRELFEDNTKSRASYQDLRTHGIYDSFFTALEQVLVEQGHLMAADIPQEP